MGRNPLEENMKEPTFHIKAYQNDQGLYEGELRCVQGDLKPMSIRIGDYQTGASTEEVLEKLCLEVKKYNFD
jgi:hypothetical protein